MTTSTREPRGGAARRPQIAQRARRRRRRRIAALVVAVLVAPVLYSYATAMLRPSSLPLSIRTVEWIRSNHGAWIVNHVESWYYTWQAPSKGGPQLRSLPTVGLAGAAGSPGGATSASHRRRVKPPYRPPAIAPLITPALAGEGVWHPAQRWAGTPAPVLETVFRPDPSYPRIVAYTAWIDHRSTQLALYPGRYEPPAGSPRGPMEVPAGQRYRLLATFNSGFTHGDGHGGFSVDGHTYEPLVRGYATLVGHQDGRVDIVDWHGGANAPAGIVLARQNVPLIVDHGRPAPGLDNNGAVWGYTLGNAVRVWRSAVGIDRHGNLIYAAADYQTAASIAAIMVHAGAVRAMELDINAEWPTFNDYRARGGRRASKMVPNSQQSTSRYLVPDDRDFFAVYLRNPGAPGGFAVPFR
jgi:Phosphodiester glycosidase